MVKRIGTARRKTKHKSRQYYRNKGKLPLSRYFQNFNLGDKVALSANLAHHPGLYLPRFHGQTGTITKKRGYCYQVQLKNGKKIKTFNVHPVHLKKIK